MSQRFLGVILGDAEVSETEAADEIKYHGRRRCELSKEDAPDIRFSREQMETACCGIKEERDGFELDLGDAKGANTFL